MINYILNDLKSQVFSHFALNDMFKKINNSNNNYFNHMRYDLKFRYEYYCLLNNNEIDRKEFNSILNLVEVTLSNKGYETTYNTDENMLHITRRV